MHMISFLEVMIFACCKQLYSQEFTIMKKLLLKMELHHYSIMNFTIISLLYNKISIIHLLVVLSEHPSFS
jgi:hypothetical protein